MSHPLLILPLMLAALPLTSPRPADDPRARCPKPAIAADKAMFYRLGELPPAESFRAVLRSTDCPATVIHARDRLGPVPKLRR